MSLDTKVVTLAPSTLSGLVVNNDVHNSNIPWTVIAAVVPGGGPGSTLRASRFTFEVDPAPIGTTRTATLTVKPGSDREITALQQGSVVVVVQFDGNACTEELTINPLPPA